MMAEPAKIGRYDRSMARTEVPGIRERAREVLREELADVALCLFEEHGFDHTTVDDIAVAAGISPRTFYRYFGTKEDVLFGDLPPTADALRDTLAQHLLELPPWEALHQTFQGAAAHINDVPDRWSRLFRVVNTSETLRARNLEKHIQLAELLTPEVLAHVDLVGPLGELRARVLVHAALVCFDVAAASWAGQGDTGDLVAALDTSFTSFPPSHR